jgi:hypothetical protein
MGCATSLLAAKDESEDLDLFNQLASATFTDHASLTSTALTVVIFGATGDWQGRSSSRLFTSSAC